MALILGESPPSDTHPDFENVEVEIQNMERWNLRKGLAFHKDMRMKITNDKQLNYLVCVLKTMTQFWSLWRS